ncbi:MAG: hypothetical protein IPK72_21155 [Candidatus Eisenbacteria bacterium]|nr:hypothetical protein [Candidatus Eisenbacteria bacterium]
METPTARATYTATRRLVNLHLTGRRGERADNLRRFGLFVFATGDSAEITENQADAAGRPCLRVTAETVEVLSWGPGAICHKSEGVFPNNYGLSLLKRPRLTVKEAR